MIRTLLLSFLFLTFFQQTFSQTDLFNLSDGGKVIMNSGDTITGIITYDLSTPLLIYLVEFKIVKTEFGDNIDDKSIKPKVLNIANIKEFFFINKYKGRHYYPIALMGFGYGINDNSSKIKVLQLDSKSEEKTNNQYTVVKEYYVLLPGQSSPASFSDIRLMPFNKKMGKAVESCPSLAQKIINKEEGYKMGLVFTEEQKIELVKKIASEFENCK